MLSKFDGDVCSPKGFKASGVLCGIKKSKRDLAVIFSETPANSAAVFTQNKFAAAPLVVSKENLKNGIAQAVVVNSGNANACTGTQGISNAKRMAELTAKLLRINSSDVLVASTGVIGVQLPMNKIEKGIKEAVKNLKTDGGKEAACAIMTTDTFQKTVAVKTEIGGAEITIGGIAKGSGMIHPNMATMLGFITTDVKITTSLLKKALKESVEKSFNMITVDGDTSTNDMVAVLANGLANNNVIETEGEDFEKFKSALDEVTVTLAKAIVRDGEGATKFIEVEVKGAETFEDAKTVAMAVANSNLVKTAFFGEDANWGRIVCAAGYSGANVVPEKLDLFVKDFKLVENGTPTDYSEEEVSEYLKNKELKITIDLGLGNQKATAWTCDLSYDYVKINGSYRT
ncbi:MAG: glutamate N-acetyltransferase / amino-acid N-acetyltransferase [Thermosediminibacterales bacterium]|nr:glutamate N-acetyltransferase / amino-acid N-acetyltransferase [Thermosediminibacterales bacterium]